jgi:NADPH:quinone reductase-like Zn-dependent oxidoreductase
MPEPKEGEVLVKINTVSLNYRDTEGKSLPAFASHIIDALTCSTVVMGLYTHHKSHSAQATAPLVPCSDICGTVIYSASPSWNSWKEGQRVTAIRNQTFLTGQINATHLASGIGFPESGVLTEYRCFSADALVAAPDYLSDEEACCLPIAGTTAWMSLFGFKPMGLPKVPVVKEDGKAESVLIQGTGGVSIAGLQIAHAAGMKTIVTSSSDEKLARAKALGADDGINYRTTTNWQDEVLRLTDGEGVDIIFENGGARTLRKSFDCVAFGGLINCIGYLSGKEDAEEGDRLNTNVLALRRNVTLKGILNGPKDRFEEMLRFYEKNRIRPVVDRVFEFEQAKEALEYLYSGGHFGKVVVRVAL